MSVRRLGWAGVELEAAGETILIDPLADPAAVFAPLGPAADGELPAVVRPLREQHASAALLTHLHRDHADAAALRQGLVPGSPVYQPHDPDGDELENLGIGQAVAAAEERFLAAAGGERYSVQLLSPGESLVAQRPAR